MLTFYFLHLLFAYLHNSHANKTLLTLLEKIANKIFAFFFAKDILNF